MTQPVVPDAQPPPAEAGPAIVLDPKRAQAFLAGQYGLPAGARVHVKIGGKLGTVPAESLQSTLSRPDAAPATAQEVHDSEQQRKYGDAVGQLQAGGLGLAKGLTAGLSTPLIVGAAGAIGGEETAKRARETLSGLEEANPVASGIGETVGAIAPLAVGDAAGLVGEGLRGAGGITRGIASLGELAGTGAELLPEGTTFLSRLAKSAVREAANAGTQTALISAGNQISEDTLGDTETNGEKLWQAVGHGFLLGAAGGGLLGATGAMGREILGRAAPKLADAAEIQAARAVSTDAGFQKAVAKIPGGEAAFGRDMLDKGIVAAGDDAEAVAQKAGAWRETAGQKVGESLDVADNAYAEADAAAKEAEDAYAASGTSEDKAAAKLARDKAERLAKLGGPSFSDIRDRIKADVLPDLEKMGETNASAISKVDGVMKDLEAFARRSTDLPLPEAEGTPIKLTFRQAQDFRRRLDEQIKWETNPMAPVNATTVAMKGVRASIEGALTDAGEKVGDELGGAWKKTYEAAKLDYRRAAVASDWAERSATRGGTVGAGDRLIGAAGLAGGLASHGIVGGLHGVALGAIHHVVRERGNATAAALLDKLSAMGGIQRAIRMVDTQIDRGIANAVEPGSRAAPRLRDIPHDSHGERVDSVMGAATNPTGHAQDIEDAVAPITPHAPMISNAFQRSALRATAMLASKVPPGTKPTPSITPQFDRTRSTSADRSEFDRLSHLTHDPVGYTFQRLDSGTLTKADVDALDEMAPGTLKEIREKLRLELAGLKKPLPYARKLQIETLMGTQDEGAYVGQILEQAVEPSAAPGGGGGKVGAPKRALNVANTSALTGAKP